MSLELAKIVINKRTGVIHTKKCEAVKQMKEANRKLSKVKNIKQLEESKPCGHCIKKRDLRKLYTEDYERRKKLIEERRLRDHKAVDEKYDDRRQQLELIYQENIQGLDD